MSRVVAVANAKGGVGKTTSTVNLAAALVERGRRVLVVDLDPQASLTLSLGLEADSLSSTVYNAMTPPGIPVASIVKPTAEGYDLVPANRHLMAFGEGGNSKHLIRALRSALEPVRHRYDYVLIDCPANVGILTGSALAAADEVLIPLGADYLTLNALAWFLSVIKEVQGVVNPGLRIAGIFMNMFDPRTRHARQIVERARQDHAADVPFFATSIRFSVSLRDAALNGTSVLRYAPASTGAEGYRSLAGELEEGLRAAPVNELYLALMEGDRALEENDAPRAFASFCRATAQSPKLARAWTGRAESAPDWEEKVRCLGRAVQIEPGCAESVEALNRAVLAGIATAGAAQVHSLITSAQFLEAIHEPVLAKRIYDRLTELDPKNIEAFLGRARTAIDPKSAVALVKQGLQIDPDNAAALRELGAAEERCRAAAGDLVEQGVAQARANNAEAAHALFGQATDLDPLNDRAWVEMARTAPDYASAFEFATHALKINPQNAQARELARMLYAPEDKRSLPPLLLARLAVLALIIVVIVVAVLMLTHWVRL